MRFLQKGGAEVFIILFLVVFASLMVKLNPLSLFEISNNNPQTVDTSSIANVAKYIASHLCRTYPLGTGQCDVLKNNLFDRLVPNPLVVPPNIFTVAMRPSDDAHPNGRYGCTDLVIDAYNTVLDPHFQTKSNGLGMPDTIGCIGYPGGGMIDFFKKMKNHGYMFLNFSNNSSYTDQQVLRSIKPGWAIFFSADKISDMCPSTEKTITGQFWQHTGIVGSIKIDSNGNGELDTYEADAGSARGKYDIRDWHFPAMGPPGWSIGGFGGYNNTVPKVTIPAS